MMPTRAFGLAATILALAAVPALAADSPPPRIDRIRAFQIYEEKGDLSKNIAGSKGQIEANSREGYSVQMLIDVILKTKGPAVYSNKQPFLYVTAIPIAAQVGDPPLLDTGYPIFTVGEQAQIVRSVIVDHACAGFTLTAKVMVENQLIDEYSKDFPVFCGD